MPEDAEILAGLYGLRATAPDWTAMIAAFAVGLLVAGLLALLLQSFRKPPARMNIAEQIAGIRAIPDPQRIAAMSALLKELTDLAAPGETHWVDRAIAHFGLDERLMGSIGDALYRPDAIVEPADLEAALRRAARISGA